MSEPQRRPRGPHGPGGPGMMPGENAKDFKGTIGKLLTPAPAAATAATAAPRGWTFPGSSPSTTTADWAGTSTTPSI